MTGEAKNPNRARQPLDDIKVLDLSRVFSGPFCTMQLGDLGAEVVKIEKPGTGDQTRGWHPPTYDDSDDSTYYLSLNRNKRSLTLNLAEDEGQEVLRTLVSKADVIVENFRTGKMEEWGLGFESLQEENPELIYCSITGYGEWGPYRHNPAYDIIMQAESGLMSITGEEGRPPIRVGLAVADISAGMYASQAILAAIHDRESTGSNPQKIDISLFDSILSWMTYMAESYLGTGESPTRMGSKHPNIAPYQAYETKDGYVVIAVASEKLWTKFCHAIDRPSLLDDERFRTNKRRVNNRDSLDEVLREEFRGTESEKMVEMLLESGIPAATVNTIEEAFEHPQTKPRGMKQCIDHPSIEELEMLGIPMNFSHASTSLNHHPPSLGEHTYEILEEIGYQDEAIEQFASDDVI